MSILTKRAMQRAQPTPAALPTNRPISEETALKIAKKWLFHHHVNRIVLSDYVCLTLRRLGRPISSSLRGKKSSLQRYLVEHGVPVEVRSHLKRALCIPTRGDNPEFWADELNLLHVLNYCGLSATHILVHLGQCNARDFNEPATSDHAPQVLALLDSLWEEDSFTAPLRSKLAHVGQFLREEVLNPQKKVGIYKKLARTLAPVMGWRTSSCEVSLNHVLNGRNGGWNVRSWQAMAEFAKTTPEKLADAYTKWATEHLPFA